MRRYFKKLLISLLLPTMVLMSAPVVHAQEAGGGGNADVSGDKSPLEIRNAVGTILISGLVGGILGLSTLSFYPRPQDNIRNIFFGAGAGMIVAALWMTFNVATKPVGDDVKPSTALLQPNLQIAPIVDAKQVGVFAAYRF